MKFRILLRAREVTAELERGEAGVDVQAVGGDAGGADVAHLGGEGGVEGVQPSLLDYLLQLLLQALFL